jgi:hypothetical protein
MRRKQNILEEPIFMINVTGISPVQTPVRCTERRNEEVGSVTFAGKGNCIGL